MLLAGPGSVLRGASAGGRTLGWLRARLLAGPALAILVAGPVRAQDPPGVALPKVDSLIVEGNQRIPADQIVATAGIPLFQPVNFRAIQQAIQALYRSGQFDDVRIEQRESPTHLILAIIVRERPLLQRWVIQGAQKIEESTVRGRIKVLEGRPIDRSAVAQSRAAIDSLYRQRGYYAAVVRSEEVVQPSGAVQVVFAISEGSRVAISQVVINGNENFSDQEIVGAMRSKPEGFWWYRKGEFKEELVEEDMRVNLPAWYADRGYVDFQVLSDSLVADTIPGKATLILDVDEGPQYRIGTIEAIGNRRYSTEDLAAFLPFAREAGVTLGDGQVVGTVYNQSEWNAATERLNTLYGNTGYIYSQVRAEESPRTAPDGTRYLDLRWNINEGSPATINRILIVGNDVTHERVIREQILLVPGQVFNRDLMIRSYEGISNLNFFEQPLPIPDIQPTANGVDVDIIFRVTERRTGNINFGASLGQGTGIGGFIGLEEPNLFGRGKRGTLQWQFGRNVSDFNLSYTDPAIRESRISGTLALFNSRQRFTIGDLGTQRQIGGNLQLGFPLMGSRFTRVFVSYGLQLRRFTGSAGELLNQFNSCDNCTRSTVGLGLSRDLRIGLPFPTAGTSFTLNTEMNGGVVGGTGRYQKLDFDGRYYTPLGRMGGDRALGTGVQFVLGLTAKSGFISGDTGPFITERFSMGGVQFGIPLRGYEEFSITPDGFDPSAGSTNANVNSFGKAYAAFTLEAGARLSQSLYINSFFDAGNTYRRVRDYNPSRLFRSYGFGVAVISPLGPLGLDLGYGLDKVDAAGRPDPSWQVHFRLGNFF